MADPAGQNPYAPPEARVEDVRDDSAPAEPAGRGARLGAAIIDTIILVALVVPVWIWGFGKSFTETMSFADTLLYMTFAYATYFVINGAMLAKRGQSVGKRLLDIRIVRRDGSRAGLLRLFGLRYAANSAMMVIPFIGWIYGLVDTLAIFGSNRRCIHDHIADTIVIKA